MSIMRLFGKIVNNYTRADIKVNAKDRLKLLEWANAWNNNLLPIRIQIAKEEMIASSNLVTTSSTPLNEDRVLQAYLGVVQIWPILLESLKKNDILLDK